MIVKIQISQFSSAGFTSILVYDESRDFQYETHVPEEVEPIIKLMNSNPKAYFNAKIVGTKFQILSQVKKQNW